MTRFKEVNPKLDLPKAEEAILKFWDKEKIFEQSLKLRKDAERFVFFEGPPTANAKPGIHHLITRYFKDLIPRFKTMQGYLVDRKAGWDTHGLPVEIAVEKALGLKSKQEIEKYGVKEFNQKARDSVWEYKALWEDFSRRSAFWLDYKDFYISHDPKYVESLWWIIKQIWDKDLFYRGHKIVPYCSRCGTALSSHEVAQGYREVEDNSVFVKFELLDKSKTFVLVWTTTPWTLPGNAALAVSPKIKYVKVNSGNEKLILAKELVEKVIGDDAKIEQEFLGKDLIGKKYKPLFPEALEGVDSSNAWQILSGDFVTTTEGTGIVHIAPMYGEDDYQLGQKHNLPTVHTVSLEGKFLPNIPKWVGKFVKSKVIETEIVADLDKRNLLFKEEKYIHDYPFCWRCDTPLLYYADNSWFIKMSALRKELIANNETINWVPEHFKEGRFGGWLKEVKDWAISRSRYWGTPLPIWGNGYDYICIGSFEELKELAKDKKLVGKDFDPHKPLVDEIVLVKDGKEYTRVPEVTDTWFDSGSMPFAQWHYPFENRPKIEGGKAFPADYISEAVDQTRGWFYTLLAVSTVLGRGAPYKNVICLGHVLDKQGKKMSKSKGNVVDPWAIFENYGSDVLRWYFYTVNQPGLPKNFDEEELKRITRSLVLTIWNTLSFFTTYANLDKFVPSSREPKPSNVLDKWLLARLNQLILEVTTHLNNYDITNATSNIEKFVDDLSNWYVRRSRKRFWKSENNSDKQQAHQTLYWSLKNLSMLMAPFMPLVAEMIYEVLKQKTDPVSIHLTDWPQGGKINEKIILEMSRARKIVEMGHALREEAKIKVRQPLAKLQVAEKKLSKDLSQIVIEELNIKQIVFDAKESQLDSDITVELEMEGLAREIIRCVQTLRKESKLEVADRIKLYYQSSDPIVTKVFSVFDDYIKTETLAKEISEDSKAKTMINVNNKQVSIGLTKI
ncbi:isoleucine--tRNA ligase [Patescibacteria group bacterium]|nr:isoleucine--tRNA ligase [Patescibacteria group bacterium]